MFVKGENRCSILLQQISHFQGLSQRERGGRGRGREGRRGGGRKEGREGERERGREGGVCVHAHDTMIHQCTGVMQYFLPQILNKLSRYLRYIYICINKHGKALFSISAHPPSAF